MTGPGTRTGIIGMIAVFAILALFIALSLIFVGNSVSQILSNVGNTPQPST